MRYPKRTFFTIFLLASIFFMPWWVAIGLAIGVAFYFKKYYEIIALGTFFDILYGTNGGFAIGYGMMGFMVASVLFLIIERVKKELR